MTQSDRDNTVKEESNNQMEVYIELNTNTKKQIEEFVEMVSELQKEYSCHCTLSVKHNIF